MKSVSRRDIAKFFIRLFSLSNLIGNFYPIAMEVKYEKFDPKSLAKLGELMTPWVGPELQRIGSQNDGGYLVANNIDPDSLVLSFGVGDNVEFELAMSEMVSEILLFDHTVSCMPINVPKGKFHKIGVAAKPTLGFTTIPVLLDQNLSQKPMLMKIDIEGNEWDILDELHSHDLARFSQIVGEFHNFHEFPKNLDFQNKVFRVLEKINQTHRFVSIHANNWGKVDLIRGFHLPDVMEFSAVLQSDYQLSSAYINHDLHRPNNPNADEIYLGFLSQLP